MTGPPIKELSGPVVKNLSGVLALTREEAAFDENLPCIRCERCVRACPMGLTPTCSESIRRRACIGRPSGFI